jgi:iron complex transport system substrate-binding protein
MKINSCGSKRLAYAAFSMILILAVVLSGCSQYSAPLVNSTSNDSVRFIDSNGAEFTLPHAAQRIVATNSDCTEMLIAIGAADKIVGVSDTVYANSLLMKLLPANVVNVGSWSTPNVEIMASLKPDAIICYAYANKPKNMDQIWAANLTIVSVDCYKINTLSDDARSLGMVTGNNEQAEDYAAFLDKYMKLVQAQSASLNVSENPLVYWESYTDYSTVGKSAAGNQMITLTGGYNIAGDNTTTYPKVDAEWIVYKNPAYIIKTFSATDVNTTDAAAQILSKIGERPGMNKVDAVTNGKTYVISGSIASGARSIIGIVYLAKLFHPELYKDMDPNEVLKEYANRYVPGADQALYIYPALPA